MFCMLHFLLLTNKNIEKIYEHETVLLHFLLSVTSLVWGMQIQKENR